MKVVIDMPNSPEWVDMKDKYIKPEDGELCIVIPLLACDHAPVIMQWDKEYERFLNVSEGFELDAKCDIWRWEPKYVESPYVRLWKPLGLPKDVDTLVKKRIKEWNIKRRRTAKIGDNMTGEKAITLLRNEIECVKSCDTCDRDCGKCSLVRESGDIIDALEYGIRAIRFMDNSWKRKN